MLLLMLKSKLQPTYMLGYLEVAVEEPWMMALLN